MTCQKLLAITLLFHLTVPAFAQGKALTPLQQKLTEANRYCARNDYFMGMNLYSQACNLLRQNASAMPGVTFTGLASKIVDSVNNKIKVAGANGDIANETRMIYALQSLVNNLVTWDAQNPRWHYEKAWQFRNLSATLNDQYPVHLLSAVEECKAALAISGGGSYRGATEELMRTCQTVLTRRKGEIEEFQKRICQSICVKG